MVKNYRILRDTVGKTKRAFAAVRGNHGWQLQFVLSVTFLRIHSFSSLQRIKKKEPIASHQGEVVNTDNLRKLIRTGQHHRMNSNLVQLSKNKCLSLMYINMEPFHCCLTCFLSVLWPDKCKGNIGRLVNAPYVGQTVNAKFSICASKGTVTIRATRSIKSLFVPLFNFINQMHILQSKDYGILRCQLF